MAAWTVRDDKAWEFGDYYGLWVGDTYLGAVDYRFADNPQANYTEIFIGPAGAIRSPVTAPKVVGGLLLALVIFAAITLSFGLRRRRRALA